jgi:hypothetical protein
LVHARLKKHGDVHHTWAVCWIGNSPKLPTRGVFVRCGECWNNFFKLTVLARATSEARTRGSIPVARAEGIEEASLEGYQFG